jgi:hypothetical protein
MTPDAADSDVAEFDVAELGAPGFEVSGAWTRKSVSVEGSEPFETQRVYWLQAGPCYADIRVPFHPGAGASCFSGRSGWDGGRFRWTHRLDLVETGAVDVGDLFWDGDRLIERGTIGDPAVAYEEVWVRLPDDGGESEALEAADGCHVQVGGHAITIVDGRGAGGSFGASYRVRFGDRWESRAVIGRGAAMPVLSPATDRPGRGGPPR